MEADLASALDVLIDDPVIEAKFNALKKLQSLKIKSLMGSIDVLQKENLKLKAMGKDSRRTQMIQSLKDKLKNQELVADFLKNELVEKNKVKPTGPSAVDQDVRIFNSVVEVNQYLIKKTIGGPARFRPDTREELENKLHAAENKIADLKRIKSAPAANFDSKVAEPKPTSKASKADNKNDAKINVVASESNDSNNILVLQLTDQLNALKSAIEVKAIALQESKEETARLRVKNAELSAIQESAVCDEKKYKEMLDLFKLTNEKFEDADATLEECREEVKLVKLKNEAELESQIIEMHSLSESYERMLKENTSLLGKLAKLEKALGHSEISEESYEENKSEPRKIIEPQAVSKDNRLFEQKLAALRAKLAESEFRCTELEEAPKRVTALLEELRVKNEQIRELKRTISELSRRDYPKVSADKEKDELISSLYDEIRRLSSEISRFRSSERS